VSLGRTMDAEDSFKWTFTTTSTTIVLLV